ncbi:MAG: hypothetical protein JNK87_06310 [Bryobacterales bacterium]|nr:hypothetical protein [Bryobacterales bacterium]
MLNVTHAGPAALRLLFRLLLAAAIVFALLLAWADYLFRTGTSANIRRAAQLVPFHPLYQARAGNLARAVELDPYFSSAWRELGEQAERENRTAEAERYYLRAAAVDQQFAPRWTLANFYFRQERWAEFDHWIRLAAERSYGDRTALFRLAHAGGGKRPVLALWPADRELLRSYVQYLAGSQAWEEAVAAARRWLEIAGDKDRDAALDICEQLVAAGQVRHAWTVWRAAVDKILPEYRAPTGGNLLTNAGFRVRPVGKAFDWRPLWRQGLEAIWSEGRMRLHLDGRQYDRTELLEQMVAVEQAGRYRLEWESRAEGLQTGLRFRVMAGKGGELATADHDVARGSGRVLFEVPKGVEGVRVVLLYERKPGTVRQEGTLFLAGSMRLQRALE